MCIFTLLHLLRFFYSFFVFKLIFFFIFLFAFHSFCVSKCSRSFSIPSICFYFVHSSISFACSNSISLIHCRYFLVFLPLFFLCIISQFNCSSLGLPRYIWYVYIWCMLYLAISRSDFIHIVKPIIHRLL